MRKGKLKKALALALTGAVIIGAFAGCGAKKDSSSDTKKEETKKIVIGASPSPHADILKVAKKELKKEGKTMVFVTHSMESVRNLCDRAIWLYDGKIRMDGNTNEVVNEYLRVTT